MKKSPPVVSALFCQVEMLRGFPRTRVPTWDSVAKKKRLTLCYHLLEGAQSSAAWTSKCHRVHRRVSCLSHLQDWPEGDSQNSLSPHPHPIHLVNVYSPLTTMGQSVVIHSPLLRRVLHPSEMGYLPGLFEPIRGHIPNSFQETSHARQLPQGLSLLLWPTVVDMEALAEDVISVLTEKNCHWDRNYPLA